MGVETPVNSFTTGDQTLSAVAIDAAGDYVVVWQDLGQDGSGFGVYGQRFNSTGVPQAGEFQVNTFTTSDQSSPSVAMDATGNFVVTWDSIGQEGAGSGTGVFAKRYNAAGTALGAEFQVNSYTTGAQRSAAVAMNAAGNFVITWQSNLQDGNGYGIYAQRFDAAGSVQGTEFKVNSYTTNAQSAPSVAMDTAGDFVVSWQSFGQDLFGYGIYAQRYDAAGAVQLAEFKVNTYTTNTQSSPSVAIT